MNSKLIDYCFRALITGAVRDVLRDISQVNERLPSQDLRKREGPLRGTWTTFLYPVDVAWIAMCRDKMEQLAIVGIDMSVVGLTQAHGAFDHRVKDRRKVTREFVEVLNISAVAVCWSSDSVSSDVRACTSSKSRAFSMAMTPGRRMS